MASTTLKTTKAGKQFYEIRVRDGREGQTYACRWYVPDGWSKRSIERELNKAASDFENKVKAGEVKTRRQRADEARQAAEESAKIKTLKQYGESVFMPALTVTCTENTRSNYQTQLDTHIYPVLGSYKLKEITSSQINTYLLKKQNSGLSWATCIKHYNILNRLFKMAYWDELIERNPMDKVSRPKQIKTEDNAQEVKFYTAEEIAYIQKCLEQEPLQWRVLVSLYMTTGARRGEILGLKWKDIDAQARQIHINRTLCYTPKKGMYTNPPKSGKSRTVPVPDYVFEMIGQLKREQLRSTNILKVDTPFVDYVFRQERTNIPMHPDSPTRYFKKFGQRYGVKGFHPHKLRHSFASIAITQGADIASVSEILGHSDKAVTLRMYTHADEESKRRASSIFEKAIAIR